MDNLKSSLVKLLKENARMSDSELAAMTGRAETEVKAAIEELEKEGTLMKYTALVNEDNLGKEVVEAMIEVKVSPSGERGFDEIAEYICQFEEVKNLYLMSGGYDLAIYIEGDSLKQVARFVSEKLSGINQVLSTATHFVLKRYKIEGISLDDKDKDRLIIQA